MEAIGAIASVCGCLCTTNVLQDSVRQQLNHLKNPRPKLEELEKKTKELNALMEHVNTKLNLARREYGKEPTPQVKLWIENVQNFGSHQGVEKSRNEKRCFCGCFPNYCSRLELGELIENKINEVTKLILEKGKIPDDSLAEFSPEMGNTLPTTTMMGNSTNLKEIWNYIQADEVGRIGVYGMGGVGKTTIMREIYNRLREEVKKKGNRFDDVFWVTVSQKSSIEKLQANIAEGIGFQLSDQDVMRRAGKLSDALKERKRFVLILDDLWEPFSLEDIGIPIPTKENGCKLILTTRSFHVCRSMETEKEVQVKVLSEKESWDLFVSKVGSSTGVLVDEKIRKVAEEVAKECDGLPLALVTVGRALRKVNKEDWQNALTALRGSTSNVAGMEEKVFSRLRFSYDRLKDDETRSCFLYSALYPEDHEIEAKELIEYWMWEGLLGKEGRIKNQIWKGEMILNDLIDSCLLENGRFECVKMHDLIRDMAIDITNNKSPRPRPRPRPHCMIRAGVLEYNQPPLEEEWIEDVERISLMHNNLKFLQGSPNCPKLSSLLLQNNCILKNISHSFFSHMHNLKVLDLSHTDISFLPDSVSYLRNLRALLLSWCRELTSLPSMAKLEALRVLDLSYTKRLEVLPEGMEMLCNLRRLNLTRAKGLRMFPARLLTKLTLVEELLMSGCQLTISGSVFVDELINSKSTVALELCFESADIFNKYVRSGHWNSLQSFRFSIGSMQSYLEEKTSVGICGNLLVDGAPILLPGTTTELNIMECHDFNRLSNCISSGAMQLENCWVGNCDQMECVVFNGDNNNLKSLEILELYSLRNLRTICKGVVAPGTFASLKKMYVHECGCLKSLFTPGLCQCLGNLEKLCVEECPQMNVIIEDEGSSVNNITATINFPKLHELELEGLKELKSFYSGEIVCDSMRTIRIRKCKELKRLPIRFLVNAQQQQPLITPSVLNIVAHQEWWDSVELDNPQAKTVLQQTAQFDWRR